MRGIKPKNHNLGTYEANQISLSCFDDKWYILKNGMVDMIADIMGNKKFQAITKEFFIRCWKLKDWLVFITQSYFSYPENVRLNTTHYFIMKINHKRELQNITIKTLTVTILRKFAQNVQRNHIIFWQ